MFHGVAEAEEAGTHSEEVPEAIAVRVHVPAAVAVPQAWVLEAVALVVAAVAVQAVGGAGK